jgi:ubiquinone/menaquinone biosynthesis C-methylase UbiE
MPDFAFNLMSFFFRVRDLVSPRESVLEEAGIRPGFRVLDYGCGPGAYISDAANSVGQSGQVYALDLHPLAVRRVQRIARKRRLANVETIQSDCHTGLPDDSLDIVLLYDIFHMLSEPETVLTELHRVLVPGGTLSVLDPHISEDEIVSGITGRGLFRLAGKGEKTYRFAKRNPQRA